MLLSFIHLNGEVCVRGLGERGFVTQISSISSHFHFFTTLAHHPQSSGNAYLMNLMVIVNLREYCELNCVPPNDTLKS